MTFAVIWTSAAMTAYRRLRAEDRSGAALTADAVGGPGGRTAATQSSRPLGTTGFRALRINGFRVLHEVDDVNAAIVVHSVGRVAGSTR